jgi:hypothetical protein
LSSRLTSAIGAFQCDLVPQASWPDSVDAWVAPYRPELAFTTLTKTVGPPLAVLRTLAAWSWVIARDGRPGLPAGRSMSSITLRPIRS